ncbi:MAG: MATE family efflux transporter, partial [Bacteroidota bacterium]
MSKNSTFGTDPLGKLLRQQAIPASIGILVMSIYGIVDTIFVGHWVGSLGIGAITVVMPITFLISSIGMAIGIGGASIISRAFGEENEGKATRTFGNQMILTLGLSIFFVLLGFQFQEEILSLFGGKGEILEPARAYFKILLYGVPFLAWAMMSNNVIRAEGYPKIAMFVLLVPAITNIILDPIFIVVLDMGIKGAAWATTLAYIASATFATWYFLKGDTQMRLTRHCFNPSWPIIKEIASIGSVTLARQGTISVLSIVLNNALFTYGGEIALSIYGIIGRVLMFANFPVLGITQGFVPIVGFNYGAKLYERVKDLITISMKSAS